MHHKNGRRRPNHVLPVLLALLATACASPTGVTGPDTQVRDEYRVGAVLFTATARRVVGSSMEVTLTATNETDAPAQVSILGGNCMLRPRVYSKRGGKLLWSYWDLPVDCQEPLRVFDLEGGESESVTQAFSVYFETGDNFITATIEAGGGLVELAAGTVNVD